jgi:hypothetical protein
VTTPDVIRYIRPDLDGLDDRSERLREDVKKRADATREDVAKRTAATRDDVAKRTAATRDDVAKLTAATRDDILKRMEATREQLAALAGDVGEDLGERAGAAREALLERYHELEQELPIEEVATKAQIGAWRALQTGLTGLLTLPAMAVRALGALSGIADDLAERGADVSERGRELVAAVPPSKAERRRSRTRTAGVASVGFVGGLAVGWVLAARRQTVVTYEPTLPANWEPTPGQHATPEATVPEATIPGPTIPEPTIPEPTIPDPTTSGVATPDVTSQATAEPGGAGSEVLDVRSETERDEPGRGA